MKTIKKLLIVATLVLFLSSCMSHRHVVGNGGTGNNFRGATQVYLLYGLIPLGEVDTQELADGASNYTIHTSYGFFDWLGTAILGGIVAFRTVGVTK